MKASLSHPDKLLFPKSKITKQQLWDYYEKVAKLMLPLIKNRPISMKRYPEGIKGEGFFQKNAPQGTPDWVKTVEVKREERDKIDMILCNDKSTLLWLANLDCITPHIWLSKIDKPDFPDRLVFDLDPPPKKGFAIVVEAALLLKEILEKKYKLKTFVTTTGSKGLHVVVPIKRTRHFDEARAFARQIAEHLVELEPQKYTTESRLAKRRGRLYIDTVRNAKGQTVMAPYAVRPIEGAPVAAPLFWKELEEKGLKSTSFNIHNIDKRLKKNPWAGIARAAKTLPKF
ncbi:MAG: non-homologous end-joining DNA ligase [Verrucomicrobia bacterium]|nr:non-homologous end-joining DNA ligase [Verrucomicrobiota bacterium]